MLIFNNKKSTKNYLLYDRFKVDEVSFDITCFKWTSKWLLSEFSKIQKKRRKIRTRSGQSCPIFTQLQLKAKGLKIPFGGFSVITEILNKNWCALLYENWRKTLRFIEKHPKVSFWCPPNLNDTNHLRYCWDLKIQHLPCS